MPLPNTLTGMIGFIIFVGGITSLLYIDLNPNDPIVQLNKANEDAQNQFQHVFTGLNQSTGSVPDSSGSLFSITSIVNFFLYLFFMPLRILTYIGIITIVLSPAGGLPSQFIILDFIIVTTILIGVYKALRAWTE
jgi:hypothetical protein